MKEIPSEIFLKAHKIGDIVICIHPNTENTLFEVIGVKEFLIKIKSDTKELTTPASMFRLATEKEIKKKQLKQIFNK